MQEQVEVVKAAVLPKLIRMETLRANKPKKPFNKMTPEEKK